VPVVVDLTELPTGALDVSVGGKRVAVDVVSLAGGALSVRVAGRMVDLTTEGQPPELGAIASGHRSYVRVESERQRAAAAAKKGGAASNDKLVKSPMPGRVIRLLVAAKDEVAQGQTLCVIEAMKMENEVKAKGACIVAEVHVTEGATVEANGKLFTLA
jgi:biotin carboxyl carrier protein